MDSSSFDLDVATAYRQEKCEKCKQLVTFHQFCLDNDRLVRLSCSDNCELAPQRICRELPPKSELAAVRSWVEVLKVINTMDSSFITATTASVEKCERCKQPITFLSNVSKGVIYSVRSVCSPGCSLYTRSSNILQPKSEIDVARVEVDALKTSCVEEMKAPLAEKASLLEQLTSAKASSNTLAQSLLALKEEKRDNQISFSNAALLLEKTMSRVSSILHFLVTAEKYKGFVHGEFVRKTVIHLLAHKFESCIKEEYINLVFRCKKDQERFQGGVCSKFSYIYPESNTDILDNKFLVMLLQDNLGRIIAKVRMFTGEDHGWESFNESVYFVPSENKIYTNGCSLSEFYDDCANGVYRFTEKGFKDLISDPKKGFEGYGEDLLAISTNYCLMARDKTLLVTAIPPNGSYGGPGGFPGRYILKGCVVTYD